MTPIPKWFEGYVGYNEIKKKKIKAVPLSSDVLHSHDQVLYSMLLKPYVKLTRSWKEISDGIRHLSKQLLRAF